MAYWSSPVLAEELPDAIFPRSMTMASIPFLASRCPHKMPVMPPPTISALHAAEPSNAG
ncbi:hypothetical protein JW799_15360 [Cohnella algarum]|nr:hypothetical protein [Cohnella algarum]MBN2982599.1 hypothetical protein [Cohnella algarum]